MLELRFPLQNISRQKRYDYEQMSGQGTHFALINPPPPENGKQSFVNHSGGGIGMLGPKFPSLVTGTEAGMHLSICRDCTSAPPETRIPLPSVLFLLRSSLIFIHFLLLFHGDSKEAKTAPRTKQMSSKKGRNEKNSFALKAILNLILLFSLQLTKKRKKHPFSLSGVSLLKRRNFQGVCSQFLQL